jgi:hypothetical protein
MQRFFEIGLLICGFVSAAALTANANVVARNGISAIFLKQQELAKEVRGNLVPRDSEEILHNLAKYDAIWYAQEIPRKSIRSWQELRKRSPEKLMLFYRSGLSARLGHSSEKSVDINYDYINSRHPEWFLLDDVQDPSKSNPRLLENRIRWYGSKKGEPDYERFILDVDNKEFQRWAAQEFLDYVSGRKESFAPAFSGLAMDNVDIGLMHHSIITQIHPRWKYANDCRAWNKAFCDYLKVVKRALNEQGFILVVNHTLDRDYNLGDEQLWDVLYDSADGLMTEQALRHGWGDSPYFADDSWLASIQRHEDILKRGLIDWWCCYPPETGEKAYDRFLYTYCSWLLIKKPDKSFYFATKGKEHGTSDPAWYKEYDLPIGKPISNRYLKEGCWLRNYENAKIVVNPTTKVQKVSVDKDNLWLDWITNKTVVELELPPQTGRILLPTPYKPGGRTE